MDKYLFTYIVVYFLNLAYTVVVYFMGLKKGVKMTIAIWGCVEKMQEIEGVYAGTNGRKDVYEPSKHFQD